MTDFSLEDIQQLPARGNTALSKTAIPTKSTGEAFLRGPIPLPWISAAAELPGKSLHLSLAIWFRASLSQNGTIRLGNSLLAQFGVNPDAKRRALKALEDAGLIEVTRVKNKNPVVTLLPYHPGHD
ncbi:MAG: hypothetical protein KBT88_16175 [Gammaproteobacteria bacterium]|nr:hypothetical protein [Gammaproteobacteria bacterium]MBQ0841320.1 hypothetical protein [Gammaproteobacteria bacterium]